MTPCTSAISFGSYSTRFESSSTPSNFPCAGPPGPRSRSMKATRTDLLRPDTLRGAKDERGETYKRLQCTCRRRRLRAHKLTQMVRQHQWKLCESCSDEEP